MEMMQSIQQQVTSVNSGQMALTLLSEQEPITQFDLILVDWKMPGLDGLETVRQIRAMSELPKTTILLLVDSSNREIVEKQALESGVDGFINKPVCSISQLEAIIVGRKELLVDHVCQQKKFKAKHVLLADDNPINQIIARDLMEASGLVVTVANNGQEAVDKVINGTFDLVLMDIQMPILDGYQATRTIREQKQFGELPIIAMTALSGPENLQLTLAAGMNDHLLKPIDLDAFQSTLARWLPTVEESPCLVTSIENSVGQSSLDDQTVLQEINIKAGLGRVRNNQALFNKLLKVFHFEHQNDLLIMAQALDKGDMEKVQYLAHTLKGVTANLGAETLANRSGNLEISLKNQHAVEESFQLFKAAFNILMSQLAEWHKEQITPQLHGGQTGTADLDGLKVLFVDLSELLQKSSPQASDLIPTIEQALNGESPILFTNLERSVNAFEFDDAFEALKQLTKDLKFEN